MLILSLLYGRGVMSRPIAGEGLKVTVVQGNIPQSMKWDRRHATYIMQTYTELTAEASREKPDLIVWPESATPGPIDSNPRLHDEVRRVAKEAGGFLFDGDEQAGGGPAFAVFGGSRGLSQTPPRHAL